MLKCRNNWCWFLFEPFEVTIWITVLVLLIEKCKYIKAKKKVMTIHYHSKFFELETFILFNVAV